MERYNLYKELKEKGYPQQGAGNTMVNPDTGETVYIPLPSELYTQFIGDPHQWEQLTDALATAWLAALVQSSKKD